MRINEGWWVLGELPDAPNSSDSCLGERPEWETSTENANCATAPCARGGRESTGNFKELPENIQVPGADALQPVGGPEGTKRHSPSGAARSSLANSLTSKTGSS